jgi:hypothetical protein
LKAITYIPGISTGSPTIFLRRPFLALLFNRPIQLFPEGQLRGRGKGLPQVDRPREIRDSRRERVRPGDDSGKSSWPFPEKARMNHPPPRTDYRLVTVFLMKSIQKF